MDQKWLLLTVLVVVKQINAPKPAHRDSHHGLPQSKSTHRGSLPQSKSLAIPRPRFNKNPLDRRLGQEYIEQYQEMMKASQESFEMFEDRDDKRLRRLIGDDDLELMAEVLPNWNEPSQKQIEMLAGGLPRRRSASKIESAAFRRRARSQVIRRNKLNAQGMRSHKLHSKLNVPDVV